MTYTPTPAFTGTDTFTYTITDGTDTATATVTITVPNRPPTGAADRRNTEANTPITVPVLANDFDANADPLTVLGTTAPANGTVTINGDNTITYTPAASFKGTDTFTYTITDGTDTATATVTITVANAAPTTNADMVSTLPDRTVVIPVLSNDADPNGDPISILTVSVPTNGVAVVNANGTITYTPNPGFKGTDTFTYTITDGSATATATATITVTNAAPIAVDDNRSTAGGTAVIVDVLANDLDLNGDPLSLVGASDPAGGSVLVNAGGTITYTPNPGFKGTDTFTYTITDGSATATATATVTVANAAPIAVDDEVATLPATAVRIGVVANDSDPNGDPVTVDAVTQPANGATVGVATNNGDGTITFAPNAAFRGTATFIYTLSDGTTTATATVSVTVPDAGPVAINDSATTPSASPVAIDVLANDLDDNGDPLTVTAVTQPASGVAVNNGDGTVTYTPGAGFTGTDTFTYSITDGSATATATVTVTVANAPPVAVDDAATTPPSTPVVIGVLANDSDLNGDLLTVLTVTAPAHGSVVANTDRTLTYTPAAGFTGTDTFTYTITDGTDTATATVTITVVAAAANRPPSTATDAATTAAGTPATIPVLGNDTDPDRDPLTVIGMTQPGHGAAVLNPDGTITYTPAAGFTGTDTFTYTITDGTDTATATVTITVAPGSIPRPLAFTGTNSARLLTIGLTMVLGGGALLAEARRRQACAAT